MAVLVDSSTWVQAERRRLSAAAIGALAEDEPLALSVVTASELLQGVLRSTDLSFRVRRERFVRWVLDTFPVLAFDLPVAEIHAQLWSDLAASGSTIGPHDLIIAATALAHGHALLTDNVREFRRVPGLDVRQPRWTP